LEAFTVTVSEKSAGRVASVVLAGSYQWTTSAFDALRPRPLLPVAQKPLIEFVLNWLNAGGVDDAIVCGNGSTASIRAHFETEASEVGRPGLVFYEDRSPRGAAGCLKDAAALTSADTLVVADGTSIPAFDLTELLEYHRRSAADLTIVAQQRGHDAASLHPVGIYVFERKVLDAVPAKSFQDIKENLVPKVYRSGHKLDVFRVRDVSPRVLNASTYLALNHWMIRRVAPEPRFVDGCRDQRPRELHAHPTASISPDAVVLGPVLFGPGVRVHAGATVIGPSSIGAGSVIEPGAVVARSVIWKQCTVGARAMVDQSVMTDGAAAVASSTVSNTIRLAEKQPANRVKRGFGWIGRAEPQAVRADQPL
jgi:NDP-sugar pyrophosphorylase family protein